MKRQTKLSYLSLLTQLKLQFWSKVSMSTRLWFRVYYKAETVQIFAEQKWYDSFGSKQYLIETLTKRRVALTMKADFFLLFEIEDNLGLSLSLLEGIVEDS